MFNGQKIKKDFMNMKKKLMYCEDANYKAVKLSYVDSNIKAYVVLP